MFRRKPFIEWLCLGIRKKGKKVEYRNLSLEKHSDWAITGMLPPQKQSTQHFSTLHQTRCSTAVSVVNALRAPSGWGGGEI